MNEALIAAAACDYEDGMELITAELARWSAEQGTCSETDRATFLRVAELCRETLDEPERAEMHLRHAKEAFQAGRVDQGATRFVVERIIAAADSVSYAADLRSCMRLALAMMHSAIDGERPAGDWSGGDRLAQSRPPHPLRQQLEYELRQHGLGLAMADGPAAEPLNMALGGNGPEHRLFLESLAGALLRGYLEGKTEPMERIRGRPAGNRTRPDCNPEEELLAIASGDVDFGMKRRARSRAAMETLLGDVEATAVALERWIESGAGKDDLPPELNFYTMVRSLTVPHPLVGPSQSIQSFLVHMVAEQTEHIQSARARREARALLDASGVLVRAIRRNGRVCGGGGPMSIGPHLQARTPR